jgi:hypothetical protein
MDKVLASKPGGMEPDDFNSLLVHAMILHGIGESAELLKQVEGADGCCSALVCDVGVCPGLIAPLAEVLPCEQTSGQQV